MREGLVETLRFKEEESRQCDWKSQQGHAEKTRFSSEDTGEAEGGALPRNDVITVTSIVWTVKK